MKKCPREIIIYSMKIGFWVAVCWPVSLYMLLKFRKKYSDEIYENLRLVTTLCYAFVAPPVILVVTTIWYVVIWYSIY